MPPLRRLGLSGLFPLLFRGPSLTLLVEMSVGCFPCLNRLCGLEVRNCGKSCLTGSRKIAFADFRYQCGHQPIIGRGSASEATQHLLRDEALWRLWESTRRLVAALGTLPRTGKFRRTYATALQEGVQALVVLEDLGQRRLEQRQNVGTEWRAHLIQ